jgi:hypothetical protein
VNNDPSPAASPAFVVWRQGKPRAVVDLRRVNAKVRLDAYPLPKQDAMLGASSTSISQDLWKGNKTCPLRSPSKQIFKISFRNRCSEGGKHLPQKKARRVGRYRLGFPPSNPQNLSIFYFQTDSRHHLSRTLFSHLSIPSPHKRRRRDPCTLLLSQSIKKINLQYHCLRN